MEPPAPEGLGAGFRILIISEHNVISPHDDFTHGGAVPWHRFHGLGVHHIHMLGHNIGYALTGLDAGPGHG